MAVEAMESAVQDPNTYLKYPGMLEIVGGRFFIVKSISKLQVWAA